MRNLIISSAILLFSLAGCKKEDLNSNRLKVEVYNNDSFEFRNPYVIDVFNLRTGKNILSIRDKSTEDYQTSEDVLPGDNIEIAYTMFCDCEITVKYKGQKLDKRSNSFFNKKEGKINVTVPR
ncbi:hypothetical protein [Pedobacter lusitanus]|nr:hypothetical protein [Pedobacter lusitanus]